MLITNIWRSKIGFTLLYVALGVGKALQQDDFQARSVNDVTHELKRNQSVQWCLKRDNSTHRQTNVQELHLWKFS